MIKKIKLLAKSQELWVFIIAFLIVSLIYIYPRFSNNTKADINRLTGPLIDNFSDNTVRSITEPIEPSEGKIEWAKDDIPIFIIDGIYNKPKGILYIDVRNIAGKDVKIEKIMLINSKPEDSNFEIDFKLSPYKEINYTLKTGEETYIEVELDHLPARDVWLVPDENPLAVAILNVDEIEIRDMP